MRDKLAKRAVVSLSGGMDSSTLLLRLLREDCIVTAIVFDYGQKHSVEIEKAKALWRYLENNGKVYASDFHIVNLNLQDLLSSALVKGGEEVPEGHYENENMKKTVVPNRNKIFASIIQAAALSIANDTNEEVLIAMGIHAGDHAIYPDCRQEFRDADFKAFELGNWGSDKVKVYTPYLDTDKFGILEDGVKSCEELELIFNEIYRNTNTSYKPIYWPDNNTWYSDHKSASSVERVEAFIKLGRPDPAEYAEIDVDGNLRMLPWEVVVEEVKSVLNNNG